VPADQLALDDRLFSAILLTDVFEHLAQPMPLADAAGLAAVARRMARSCHRQCRRD
jgi:hypothetical protein